MDHLAVGRLWNESSDTWSTLSGAGYDTCRRCLNTPTFLAMLPDVSGLRGLDIGCGEGTNTRELAQRGARMIGMDIAPGQLSHACTWERRHPCRPPHPGKQRPAGMPALPARKGAGVSWVLGSAQELPFADATFDFAASFMVLMDVPDYALALREAARVLRPGGFLQFTITHPCTDLPHRRRLVDEDGKPYGLELAGYFDTGFVRVVEWMFGAAPAELREGLEPMRTPFFHRTVSEWLNALHAAGLRLERSEEPRAPDELAAALPAFRDEQMMPQAWIVRARKRS